MQSVFSLSPSLSLSLACKLQQSERLRILWNLRDICRTMRAAQRFRNRCAMAYMRFLLLCENALYPRLFTGHPQMQSQLIHMNRARWHPTVEPTRRASYAVSIVHSSIILLVLAILLMHEIANLASYANLTSPSYKLFRRRARLHHTPIPSETNKSHDYR